MMSLKFIRICSISSATGAVIFTISYTSLSSLDPNDVLCSGSSSSNDVLALGSNPRPLLSASVTAARRVVRPLPSERVLTAPTPLPSHHPLTLAFLPRPHASSSGRPATLLRARAPRPRPSRRPRPAPRPSPGRINARASPRARDNIARVSRRCHDSSLDRARSRRTSVPARRLIDPRRASRSTPDPRLSRASRAVNASTTVARSRGRVDAEKKRARRFHREREAKRGP